MSHVNNTIPTTYHQRTPKALRAVLDNIHGRDIRVRVWYGDSTTGKVWHEEFEVTGYIGRSTGRQKIPLIVHNRHSLGGAPLLDHCILRIDRTDTRQTLYQHKNIKMPTYTVEANGDSKLPWVAYEVVQATEQEVELLPLAAFATFGKAKRWTDFMSGKRYNK